jgi:hypothetical protein
MSTVKEARYRNGRKAALDKLGLVHKQDDNPVVDSFVGSLPELGKRKGAKEPSMVFNRMGGFGSPVLFTNSNLPANV